MDKIISYIIISFYGLLIAFAILSVVNPGWLQNLAEPGRETEARTYIDDGNIKMYSGDFQNAINAYNHALAIDTSNRVVYGNLGIAYMKVGNFKASEICLKHVERLSIGMDTLAMFNYFESMGNLEKAKANKNGKNGLFHFERALKYYELAMDCMPHEPNLDYKYANLLKRLNRDSLAVEYFNSGIRKDVNPNTYYYKALLLDYFPEIANGETECSKNIQCLMNSSRPVDWELYDVKTLKNQKLRDPQLALAYFKLGELYLRNNRADLADLALRQCAMINPSVKSEISKLKRKYNH